MDIIQLLPLLLLLPVLVDSTCHLPSLTITNITNTTVAVTWNGQNYSMYYVFYWEVNDGSGLETYPPERTQRVNVNVNGLLLEKLKAGTKYSIQISSSSSLSQATSLCNTSFKTQNESRKNAVEGVRAHVYYPFINNKTVITATVVWKNLSNEVSITHYKLRVITLYDMAMNGNEERFCNVSSESTFINLQFNDSMNHLTFPLSTNALYIAQVQGVDEMDEAALPFSEPILINTSYAKPAEELYAVLDNGTGSLIQTTSQPEEDFQTPTPITIDKRKRIIYYVDGNDIKKIGLNSKGTPETVFDGEGHGITISSLAYDWIEDMLYVAGNRNGNRSFVLLRVRVVDGTWTIIYDNSTMSMTATAMTVNPFTGFLHYITGRKIIRFNLRDKIIDTALVVNVSVLVPTLAEDVTSNCLYYIKSRNTITSVNLPAGQTGEHCPYSYPIENAVTLNSRLAIDDTGIYLAARYSDRTFSLTYHKFNNNNENDNISFMGVTGNTIPRHILTTSPGTQPLPSYHCLSPNLTDISDRPHITNYTITSTDSSIEINLKWSEPQLPDDCQSFSSPPITYRLYLTNNGAAVREYNGKVVYTTSATISGLTKGEYEVSVSARNQYTVASPDDLLKGPQMSLQQDNVSPTLSERSSYNITTPSPSVTSESQETASASKTVYPSTTSRIIVTTETPVSPASTDTVLIASATAGGVLALMLAIGIVIAILLFIISRRRKQKSYNPKTPPTSSSDPQPYAVPIDSLEEYRRNGPLPLPPAQDYEVPSVSVGHTTITDQSYSTVLPLQNSTQKRFSSKSGSKNSNSPTQSPIKVPINAHHLDQNGGGENMYSSPLSSPKHIAMGSSIPRSPSPYSEPVKMISTRNGVTTLRPPSHYSEPVSTKKSPPTKSPSPNTSPTHSLDVPSPYSEPVNLKRATPPRYSTPPGIPLTNTPSPYSEPIRTKSSPPKDETDEDKYYEPVQPVRPVSSTNNNNHHYFTLDPPEPPPPRTPSIHLSSQHSSNVQNDAGNDESDCAEQPLYSEVKGNE